MANFTVVPIADLFAQQLVVTTGGNVSGERTPTEGSILAKIWIYHALHEATANTNPGSFYVQTRGEDSVPGDSQWMTVAQFTTSDATSVTTALDATEPEGETSISVASTTSFVAGDYIYIDDATNVVHGEWHTIASITSSTAMVMADGLAFAKASGDDAWTGAEGFYMELDLAGVFAYRVLYIHRGATVAATAVMARQVEVTDFE